MSLICKPSSSPAPLPWKLKVQLMRMWKQGKEQKSENSIEIVLLESSETRIHTTIDEAFSKWISVSDDEKIKINNEANDGELADHIDISKDLMTIERGDPIKTIVKEVYGESFVKKESYSTNFCKDRVILCHKDSHVDRINHYMLSLLPGQVKLCYSDDCFPPTESSSDDYMLADRRFFASLTVPGVPSQILRFKVGAPVMLLVDVDPSRGLCRGTRLQIIRLGETMLEAWTISSSKDFQKFLIPKMHMFSTEGEAIVPMRRTQFPLTLAFAMPINKSQEETFSKVGLYLPRRVFSHGQRFVAISKVKSRAGHCKILITDKAENPQEEETKNIAVFKELFQDV